MLLGEKTPRKNRGCRTEGPDNLLFCQKDTFNLYSARGVLPVLRRLA